MKTKLSPSPLTRRGLSMFRMKASFIVLVVTVLTCHVNAAIYESNMGWTQVDDSAAGNNDGTSWDDAYNVLQDALDNAVSGDDTRVAQGTYYPTTEVGGTGNKYKTFRMKNEVRIYNVFHF